MGRRIVLYNSSQNIKTIYGGSRIAILGGERLGTLLVTLDQDQPFPHTDCTTHAGSYRKRTRQQSHRHATGCSQAEVPKIRPLGFGVVLQGINSLGRLVKNRSWSKPFTLTVSGEFGNGPGAENVLPLPLDVGKTFDRDGLVALQAEA